MLDHKKKRSSPLSPMMQGGLVLVFAALIVVGDSLLRLPFDVQGEAALVSMAVMVVAVGILRGRGVATLVGITAGIIAAALDPSRWGVFYTVLTFAALGIGFDLGLWIVGSVRHFLNALLAALMGHVLHFAVKWAYGALVGVPAGVVAGRLAQTALEHVIFGLIGGGIGYALLMLLEQINARQGLGETS